MQFLRNSWMQVKAYLEGMSASQKWLILALLVVLLLVGFIVAQYAGSPQMVPITQFAGDRQADVVTRLKSAGMNVRVEGGQIFVAQDQRLDALVLLQQSELLTHDTSAAFDQMLAGNNMWQDSAQREMSLIVAKQKWLSSIVSKMRGVKRGDVILSMPKDVGFGKTFVRPSASVNVVMQGGQRVDKKMVEAIAGLVSGAVAEMQPQDVVVIDAGIGRQFTVKSEHDFGGEDGIEQVMRVEQYHREKIENMLRYIPGVIVAVNVQIDDVARKEADAIKYESVEPLRREREEERMSKDVNHGGEPGSRSNAGMTIEGGGATGREESSTVTEREYADKPVTLREKTLHVGRQTRRINVTVNVPRPFFVALWRQAQPAGGNAPAEPTEADLAPIRDAQIAQITSQVEPLIAAETSGMVNVTMIPDASILSPMTAGTDSAAGFGSMLVGSPWTKPVGVGLLAMLALGFMLYTVRKATREEPMPTVEELAGVPPELPSDDDLVGEAGQTNATLAGVELDDEELRFREMAGQISEMIKSNPQEAGNLIGRWVKQEE